MYIYELSDFFLFYHHLIDGSMRCVDQRRQFCIWTEQHADLSKKEEFPRLFQPPSSKEEKKNLDVMNNVMILTVW